MPMCIWNGRTVTFSWKIRLVQSLVISIFLWVMDTDSWIGEKGLDNWDEMRCYCRLLGISSKDHISNAEVRNRITQRQWELTTVKGRKLNWYGHVSRSTGLAKTLPHGIFHKGREREEDRERERNGGTTSQSGQKFKALSDSLWRAEERQIWHELDARCSDAPTVDSTTGFNEVTWKCIFSLSEWMYFCSISPSGIISLRRQCIFQRYFLYLFK